MKREGPGPDNYPGDSQLTSPFVPVVEGKRSSGWLRCKDVTAEGG